MRQVAIATADCALYRRSTALDSQTVQRARDARATVLDKGLEYSSTAALWVLARWLVVQLQASQHKGHPFMSGTIPDGALNAKATEAQNHSPQ